MKYSYFYIGLADENTKFTSLTEKMFTFGPFWHNEVAGEESAEKSSHGISWFGLMESGNSCPVKALAKVDEQTSGSSLTDDMWWGDMLDLEKPGGSRRSFDMETPAFSSQMSITTHQAWVSGGLGALWTLTSPAQLSPSARQTIIFFLHALV